VCSGIEAASLAWRRLGWHAAWFAEIEPFPSAVLAHRFPEAPNYGDFTKIGADAPAIDLLVGGTPCQSFSVAGLRAGLADERGNLALEYLRLAGCLRPRWVVWENVCGVLSSSEGRDFGAFLGGLAELGYGFAYRVLDAQYFGVPQRRRRVFVVGHLGSWQRAAAVLFERHSLQGYTPPSREAREEVAGCLGGGAGERGWAPDTDRMTCVATCEGGSPSLSASSGKHANNQQPLAVIGTLSANGKAAGSATQQDAESGMLLVQGTLSAGDGRRRGGSIDPAMLVAFSCKDHAQDAGDTAPTLRAMGHDGSPQNGGGQVAVASFDERNITSRENRSRVAYGDPSHTLHEAPPTIIGSGVAGPLGQRMRGGDEMARQNYQPTSSGVRRLTPLECERLQGLPDNWTLVPYRGKPAADGPRYKAIGNSMAVPCMRWIGERIAAVEKIGKALAMEAGR